MSCIGVWRTRRNLVAVPVGADGRAGLPLRVAGTDEAAHALLAYLESVHRGAAFELVLADSLGRSAPVARVALEYGVSLWLAPDALVDAVRAVSGLATAPPPRTAAVLARLPGTSVFRPQLLRVTPGDRRQLSLW
jgi:hypothetical protein